MAPSLSFGFDDAHFDVGPRAESVLVGSLMALCYVCCFCLFLFCTMLVTFIMLVG